MWIPFGRPEALARVAGSEKAPCLYGTVKLYQMGKNILVVADVGGLPSSETGIFGLHIHMGSDCCDDFANTGSHYNPGNREHPSHAGDLPPLFSANGRAVSVFLTDRFALRQIIGKTVIIHSGPDDFTTQPSGNPGQILACGKILSRCGR